jgi:superfamily I DNA and/or RNA helicase
MDLLIPMSQAKNRIILVGDHRQLPHMIEEAIIEQIQSEDDYDEYMVNNYLKDSIFAYLFNLLKKLELKDGIVRTITLDAQYRSHPLLGEFASRCFYQPYNEGYQSPTEAKAFEHQLAGIENKAAIWLDVPHAINEKETKEGTSRYRDAEVKAIVQYLKQWLNDEENQDLSFGIITFYSEQVKRLEKLLRLEGIYLEDINRDKERLRIGSVDAFQGTEFDIVFLSIVRTKSNEELAKIDAYDTRKINQTFGFLVSKNRLCVAVTRQKRALIVVGNAQMVQSDIGQQAVPELGEFYQLCTKSEQGAVL